MTKTQVLSKHKYNVGNIMETKVAVAINIQSQPTLRIAKPAKET